MEAGLHRGVSDPSFWDVTEEELSLAPEGPFG